MKPANDKDNTKPRVVDETFAASTFRRKLRCLSKTAAYIGTAKSMSSFHRVLFLGKVYVESIHTNMAFKDQRSCHSTRSEAWRDHISSKANDRPKRSSELAEMVRTHHERQSKLARILTHLCRYKVQNFALVCYYTLMVFVILDIGTVVWGDQIVELGFSVQQLTWSFGVNTAGLAVGCVLFIPFALKFGRRVVYLFSIAVSLACAIWLAKLRTTGDLWGANLVAGLAGSISETICQMSIADIFFVHQRGTANGIYIVMVNMGAFLAPVAAGYSADSQGWRW